VVLATGGFGQAFATTTNPAGVTGDGLALAARAGAVLCDPEFVQFHPTVLWQPGATGQRPLITEALRGAGAVLMDDAGRPVMDGRHPLGDLAPRDVVAAAMHERIASGGGRGHLWLDATGLGRGALAERFPTVTALCTGRGIDPASEPIPVAPGAHYACGGIAAGLAGQTSVPGLYAVGEAAATGVHGANRLASNSLTEAMLAGQRTGDLLGARLPAPGRPLRLPPGGSGIGLAARPVLAAAMSLHAGVVRERAGLEELLAVLAAVPPATRSGVVAWGAPAAAAGAAPGTGDGDLPGTGDGDPPGSADATVPGCAAGLTLAAAEALSLHTVSVILAAAALNRAESRGCHRRRDAPGTPGRPARHTLWRWPESARGLTLIAGPVAAAAARAGAPAAEALAEGSGAQ
jgi:L-aspartate oxidase